MTVRASVDVQRCAEPPSRGGIGSGALAKFPYPSQLIDVPFTLRASPTVLAPLVVVVVYLGALAAAFFGMTVEKNKISLDTVISTSILAEPYICQPLAPRSDSFASPVYWNVDSSLATCMNTEVHDIAPCPTALPRSLMRSMGSPWVFAQFVQAANSVYFSDDDTCVEALRACVNSLELVTYAGVRYGKDWYTFGIDAILSVPNGVVNCTAGQPRFLINNGIATDFERAMRPGQFRFSSLMTIDTSQAPQSVVDSWRIAMSTGMADSKAAFRVWADSYYKRTCEGYAPATNGPYSCIKPVKSTLSAIGASGFSNFCLVSAVAFTIIGMLTHLGGRMHK